jgi:hypothetical protein
MLAFAPTGPGFAGMHRAEAARDDMPLSYMLISFRNIEL